MTFLSVNYSYSVELQTNLHKDFTIIKKAPTISPEIA